MNPADALANRAMDEAAGKPVRDVAGPEPEPQPQPTPSPFAPTAGASWAKSVKL